MKYFLSVVCICVFSAGAFAAEPPRVEIRAGDRIAFIGNDFFDREQNRDYIQTQLASRFFDKGITFRNLGYSGDTVWAEARNLCSGWDQFGPPDQGFKRLQKLVEEFEPTLIFVAYGMNESFDGPGGIEHFNKGLNRLLDMLKQEGDAKYAAEKRIVLVGPIRHENLGEPLPDPSEHNQNLQLYTAAMAKIARERQCAFIDLFGALSPEVEMGGGEGKLTSDGIHLTPYGYWRVAAAMERAMGYEPRRWSVAIDAKAGTVSADGTEVKGLKASASGLTFSAREAMLPVPPPVQGTPAAVINGRMVMPGQERILKVSNLEPGRYELKSEGREICVATAGEWERGVQLLSCPADDQAERLRGEIVSKDFDYFNYWRAENDTYIFGYRRHEQGRNAVEVPNFLSLVEKKEVQIDVAAVPEANTYELTLKAGK